MTDRRNMNKKLKYKLGNTILLSAKIGIGASVAIYIAELLKLQYATSAGIITLLTLITTRWGTFRLSVQRLLTYVASVVICWLVFNLIPSMWIEYGVFLFLVVLMTEWLGWKGTLSVNAVIGTHFLTTQDFSMKFVMNELLLVVIGITIAIILNLFHINSAHENGIIHSMRHVEHEMKKILEEVAGYLMQQSTGAHAWDDVIKLEKELEEYVELASEYHHNTFQAHQDYYVAYFEMRMKQCGALHNLHSEMRRMRQMPKQAHIVADFIMDITQYVTEMNDPKRQIEQLESTLEHLRNEPLPETHEEFETRAELYHVLMDLEEFLLYKKRFVEEIDETQFRVYWKQEIEGK